MLVRDSVRICFQSALIFTNLPSREWIGSARLYLVGIHTSGCGTLDGRTQPYYVWEENTSSVYIMSYQCNDVIENAG